MSKANRTNRDAEPLKNSATANENVTVLNSETETRDLNFRLKAMENTLQNLNQQLETAQDKMTREMEQLLSDVSDNVKQNAEEVRSETNDARAKLGYLEGSYKSLEEKSASLAKETARLTLQLNKNDQKQSDSITSLKESTTDSIGQISKEISSLDQQVGQLITDFTSLSMESQSLIGDLSDKTISLEKSLTDHEGDFKKLAQQVEAHNKQVDSQLKQVSENFSFHDAKIMKLHEKDTELESESNNIKELLHKSDAEQKQTVASLEQSFAEKNGQLNAELDKVDQKHQKTLDEHEQRLTTHDSNFQVHGEKLEQLQSVDEELTLRAQGLKETTELLNEHGKTLEKTTVSLQEQSHDLQNAVNQLNRQNELLEEKTDDLGMQIVANSQTERRHFQTMTMTISIVAVLTIIALIYSFINQQSLWQSSMDNDVAVERRLNHQLSEQKADLSAQISSLQEQLKEEKQKSNSLIKDSQETSVTLVELKGDLKEIDDNVNYLNSSVGPLRDYSRYTGKDLQNASWLAAQPAEYYAIQLVSVDSRKKLYKYIDDNGYSLVKDIAWFTIPSNGKDYYVLTYGSFEDLAQARAVLSQLPSRMIEQSPGISRLKDIQSYIN